jgi:hypothetical protein
MIEHTVFDDEFHFADDNKIDKCCSIVINQSGVIDKIIYIESLLKKYNSKYETLEQIYRSYGFNKNISDYDKFESLYKSNCIFNNFRILMKTCFRVRCNLFHGPKCVCDLDDQNLLFLALNELLSMILHTYISYPKESDNRVYVVASLIYNDGKVLIVKRSNGDPNVLGKWEFPGGKVEPEESEEHAI